MGVFGSTSTCWDDPLMLRVKDAIGNKFEYRVEGISNVNLIKSE
jgi:hypothetical protein